jgi:hypothetical protein
MLYLHYAGNPGYLPWWYRTEQASEFTCSGYFIGTPDLNFRIVLDLI